MSAPEVQTPLAIHPVDDAPDYRVVVDGAGRKVFVGDQTEATRYVQAIENDHTHPWAVTIGYWGAR